MHGLLLQFQNLDTTTRWMLLIAATLTILYAVMRPMKRKKDPLARPGSMTLAGQRAVEQDMSNLLVELSEMARQVTAQLDTRAAKLELLIKEADQKLLVLRELVDKGPAAATDRLSATTAVLDPPEPQVAVDAAHAAVYQLADAGRTAREIASELGRPDGEIELILALRLTR